MKKLSAKLNNRRGASILMALLLFLICALAGAAALTAAGSNIGRYSYLEEDQQQYLAVSSAAKLFREQLDGLEASADFEVKADKGNVEFDKDKLTFLIKNPTLTKSDVTIKRNDDGITGGDLSKLLEVDLGGYVKNAFYNYISSFSGSSEELWNVAKSETDLSSEDNYKLPNSFEYNFTVDSDQEEIGDVTVTLKFGKDDGTSEFTTSAPWDVRIGVKSADPEYKTEYELTGELKAEVNVENGDPERIISKYENTLPDGTKEEIPIETYKILKSTAKVRVTLDLDNEISRVVDSE